MVPSTSSRAAKLCEAPCRLSSIKALGIPHASKSSISPSVAFGEGISRGANLRLLVACRHARAISMKSSGDTHIIRIVPLLSVSSSCIDLKPFSSRPGAASAHHSRRCKSMPSCWAGPTLGVRLLKSLKSRRSAVKLRNDAIWLLALHTPSGYNVATLQNEEDCVPLMECTQPFHDELHGLTRAHKLSRLHDLFSSCS